MSSGSFSLAKWKWGPQWGNLSIKYASKGEWKDIKADGRNDSRKTFLGRKNAEIHLTLESRDDSGNGEVDGEINTYVRNFVTDVGPRGPNGGKSFAWVEDDQEMHNVHDVTVDEVDTERTPGTGKLVTRMTLSSWVKPKPGPIVTKTPAVSGPWSPGPTKPGAPATPKAGFAQTPPVVKP